VILIETDTRKEIDQGLLPSQIVCRCLRRESCELCLKTRQKTQRVAPISSQLCRSVTMIDHGQRVTARILEILLTRSRRLHGRFLKDGAQGCSTMSDSFDGDEFFGSLMV
jgi:hypothetical protein